MSHAKEYTILISVIIGLVFLMSWLMSLDPDIESGRCKYRTLTGFGTNGYVTFIPMKVCKGESYE